MVFEIFLNLTAHHLIHLCRMLCLNKQLRELVNLEQTVSKCAVLTPKSIIPKNFAVLLCPSFNDFIRRIG